MATTIRPIQCPKCGSTEKTEIRPDVFVCANCGTEYYLDNDDININVRQTPATSPPLTPANRPGVLGRAVVVLVILALVVGGQVLFRHQAAPASGPAATTAGADQQPEWQSPASALMEGAGHKPVLVLAGRRRLGFDEPLPATVGFYDPVTGATLKTIALPDAPGLPPANVQLKQFSNGAVDVLSHNAIYEVNAATLTVQDVTRPLLADQPALASGIADIGLGTNEDDKFYLFTNDGHHYNFYPLIHQVYTNDEVGRAAYGFHSLRPGSPVRTGFAFTQPSVTYPEEPIQLIRYQYRDNGGGPKSQPFFSWDDDYGGSGIFTDADPHVKRLITPYQLAQSRVLSFRDFTPDRLYFDAAVLYADADYVLLSFRPTAASNSLLTVQALDARTGTTAFTRPLPAEADRPTQTLRYPGGFLIGHDQTMYTLSTAGVLGPAVTIR